MKNQIIDFDQIVEEQKKLFFQGILSGKTEEEMKQIREAYDLAYKAHLPQKRNSGEPYILHPIAVARIIGEELKLGTNSIIAALLHDVVEDTPYTIDEIQEQFGDDVAFLVQAVTKEKKVVYEMSKQLDNFRKMLDSIHFDIRALLIKLADRLHNMRTLSSMDTVKQMKIASETDYFYAPLANRLGLYDIKTELENLSLKYRSPKEYLQIEDQINQYIQERQPQIKHLTGNIKKILRKGKITASVNTRIRTPYSVWRKMESGKAAFKELEHIYLIEIIFPSNPNSRLSEKNQILQIYSLLTDVYKERPASMMNYIDSPKDNGYQCLHCKVMGEDGNWVEIHIASENMQLNNRIGCVTGRANGVDTWVKKFREILKDIAYHGKNSGFLEDIVSTFYQDNIIVFSPKGDEIILPKNSTALDFAYEIHTNIGNHAKYARINARLSSVKTVLKRGDRVEIGTDKSTYPHKDWLDVVSTYKAKKSILSALRKAAVEYTPLPYLLCEHCCPLPGEEVIGFKKETGLIEVHKRNCPLAISLSAKAGDSIVDVVLPINKGTCYPAVIFITAIDRNELLFDLSQVISKELGLYISSMHSSAKDEIVSSTIHLSVASYDELYSAMNRLEQIEGVESVKRKILFS